MKRTLLCNVLILLLVGVLAAICYGSGFSGGGSGSASFPDQSGQSGKYLKSTGVAGSEAWDTPEGSTDNATVESLITQALTAGDEAVVLTTISAGAAGFSVDADGDMMAKSIVVTDGNFTVDEHGAVIMRSASYIRDAENPFCQQFYSGTNYDDNYTEICAPNTGYSETYRMVLPTAAPTGNKVMVFPAPTLGVSQGTWGDATGTGDMISTNNLSDVVDAATARSNLGLEIGADVAAYAHNHTSTEPIINIALRGGGSAISTGSAGNKRIAAAATITGYVITSSASCSIVVDLWKTTYTAYDVSTHPVDGDSITASAPITLTAAVKAKDETLTGWTKTLSADDIIHVNVDSADCTGDVDIQVYGTRSL